MKKFVTKEEWQKALEVLAAFSAEEGEPWDNLKEEDKGIVTRLALRIAQAYSGLDEHMAGQRMMLRLIIDSSAEYSRLNNLVGKPVWQKVAEEALETLSGLRATPMCPQCGSKKLLCPNGHTWEIQ